MNPISSASDMRVTSASPAMSIRGNDVQQPGAIEGGQLLSKNVEIALADLEWVENRLRLRYHALNDHAARGGPIGHGLVNYRDADSERFSCPG